MRCREQQRAHIKRLSICSAMHGMLRCPRRELPGVAGGWSLLPDACMLSVICGGTAQLAATA